MLSMSGVQFVGHTGGQQGTSTGIALASEQRGSVVVLVNMDGVDAGGLADEIIKIVFDVKDKEP
jgi:hypothetical protein